MSPSSLIFVVVIAIWVVYSLLYVARRREQMSTARSVDRFSAHMRVLQRRSVKAVPRSSALSSTGSARTSLLAAGAMAPAAQAPSAPRRHADEVPAERGHATDTRRDHRAGRVVASPLARDAAALLGSLRSGVGRLVRRPVPEHDAAPTRRTGAVRATRPFAAWAALTGIPLRQLRSLAFLCGALATVVSFALAIGGTIGWAFPVVASGLSFLALAAVRADRKAVLAARDRRAAAARIESERLEAVSAREAQAAADAAREARPATPSMPVAQEYVPPRHRADEPFDVTRYDEAPAPAAAPRRRVPAVPVAAAPMVAEGPTAAVDDAYVDPDLLDPYVGEPILGPAPGDPLLADRPWQPVPVPRPTYTMKARAARPLPPALDVPVPIEVEDDLDESFWAGRGRAVNG